MLWLERRNPLVRWWRRRRMYVGYGLKEELLFI